MRIADVIERIGALAAASWLLGCQGGEQGCPLFVGVVCVSSQEEAVRLNSFAGPCGARYEVCSPYDAAFTQLPDASLGSFLGDGAIADALGDATPDATDE